MREEVEYNLKRAEKAVREALTKALLFKHQSFCNRLTQIHAEIRNLLNEV